MSLVYPNIVPENDLRLPDALTIKHGPAALIARLILAGDQAARDMGLRLRLRHDFRGLQELARFETARGNWYKLVDYFNPDLVELTPESAYWISAENAAGEIVVTVAGRVFYWPQSSLHDEAVRVFFAGRRDDYPCTVTTPAAREITGVVLCSGAMWVRPDYRRLHLSHLLPRISRAYAASRWPLDWAFIFAVPGSSARQVAGYGYTDVTRSIFLPATDWGDLDLGLARLSRQQLYDDLAAFFTSHLGSSESPAASGLAGTKREETVSTASPDGVLQGSISLS